MKFWRKLLSVWWWLKNSVFFAAFPLKLVNIYRIARMGQNFDDYPGFQQIPGMPILLQQSVDVFWLKESNESLGNSQTDCSNKTN